MSPFLVRGLSLALRMLALGSRFLLFFVLAIYVPPEAIGLYGLTVATISYASIFLSFDFYIFANREFKKSHNYQKLPILRTSMHLYALTYLITLPLCSLLFVIEILPVEFFVAFYIILILEHAGQEMYRLLVMMERTLLAGWVLFLRLGLWAIILAFLMFLYPGLRTLEMLLLAWGVGAFLSVCFAVPPLLALPEYADAQRLGREWILRGLRTSFPYLIGTLCLRGLVTFDRYLVEFFSSREFLGIYVVLAGAAATLPAILEAGVFAFLAPKLILAAKNKDQIAFSEISRKMLYDTIFVSVIFGVCLIVAVNIIVLLFPNDEYQKNITIFYLCLGSQIIMGVSMVFHFSLYSKHHDVPIILSHIFALISFLIAAMLLGVFWPLWAVPVALIVANFTLMLNKYFALHRYQRA